MFFSINNNNTKVTFAAQHFDNALLVLTTNVIQLT